MTRRQTGGVHHTHPTPRTARVQALRARRHPCHTPRGRRTLHSSALWPLKLQRLQAGLSRCSVLFFHSFLFGRMKPLRAAGAGRGRDARAQGPPARWSAAAPRKRAGRPRACRRSRLLASRPRVMPHAREARGGLTANEGGASRRRRTPALQRTARHHAASARGSVPNQGVPRTRGPAPRAQENALTEHMRSCSPRKTSLTCRGGPPLRAGWPALLISAADRHCRPPLLLSSLVRAALPLPARGEAAKAAEAQRAPAVPCLLEHAAAQKLARQILALANEKGRSTSLAAVQLPVLLFA